MVQASAFPLLLIGALAVAGTASISDPSFTNQVLRVTSTPQMMPGDRGSITIVLHNPYNSSMGSPTLGAEIYRYVSNHQSVDINASLPTPVFAASGTTAVLQAQPDLGPSANQSIALGVHTTPSVLHAGIFDQGTYLVRFRLDFDLSGSRVTMVSLGWFTVAQWRAARTPQSGVDPTCMVGDLNYCYLGGLLGLARIEGLIPDTSFGVRDAMPAWPFIALGTASVALAGAALAAFVLEHPGRYPRLERGLRRILPRRPSRPS